MPPAPVLPEKKVRPTVARPSAVEAPAVLQKENVNGQAAWRLTRHHDFAGTARSLPAVVNGGWAIACIFRRPRRKNASDTDDVRYRNGSHPANPGNAPDGSGITAMLLMKKSPETSSKSKPTPSTKI